MNVMASLSKFPMAHPPRSNSPLRSSSGPPPPCITPSTETCVVVVSLMVAVPSRWFGRRSVRPDRRTELIGLARSVPQFVLCAEHGRTSAMHSCSHAPLLRDLGDDPRCHALGRPRRSRAKLEDEFVPR